MPFPVICPACGKSFSISDEIYELKIQGRVVSIKCRQCQTAIRIDGTQGTALAPPSNAAPGNATPPKAAALGSRREAAVASQPILPLEAPVPAAGPGAPMARAAASPDAAAALDTSVSRAPLPRRASESREGAAVRRTAVATHPVPVPAGPPRVAASLPPVASVPQRVAAIPPTGATTPAAMRAASARSRGVAASSAAESRGPRVAATPPRVTSARAETAPPDHTFTSGRVASRPRTADNLAPTAATRPPANAAESSATGPPPLEAVSASNASEQDAVLFAVDSSEGDRELTRDQIGRELRIGNLSSETLVWREGMDEWLEIKQVPDLASLLGKPEPKVEPLELIPATQPEAGNAAQIPGSPPRHFRPKQPTLLMGAPPESAFGVPRETASGVGQGAQRPTSPEAMPSPATADTRRDLRAVRVPTPPPAREAKQQDERPIPGSELLAPKAPLRTPVPTDDEPTVLRSAEAVQELLKSGDTDKDELTPVPPPLAEQDFDPSREQGQGGGESTPTPGLGLGKTRGDGRLARPGLGTATKQLASLVIPEEPAPAKTSGHLGSPPAPSRKPPIDTVRESPEAKRAWFPEQIPLAPAPPLPPVPPAAIQNPYSPPTPIPNPFSRQPATVPRPFSSPANSAPNLFASAPPPAPLGQATETASPLEPVRSALVPSPDARAPTFSSTGLGSSPIASAPRALPPSLTSAQLFQKQTAFGSKGNRVVWLVLAIALVAFAIASYVMSGSPSSPSGSEHVPKHR